MEYVRKLASEREALATQIAAMAEQAATEDRALSEAENASVDSMTARIGQLDTELRRWGGFQQAVKNFAQVDQAAEETRKDKRDDETAALTVGDAWVRSDAYSSFRNTPRGTSSRIDVPLGTLLETRALIKTDTFAGLIVKERIGAAEPPAAQRPLLDSISQVRVTNNSVEWVFYAAAAPLGTVTAEGAAKTEAAISPTVKTVTLNTIASWAQYSRQFGEDAPGLVDFLNATLGRGINDKREALAAAALVGSTDIPTVTNTNGTLLQGIRRAIAAVQTAGFRPTVVALNPDDYAIIDLQLLGKIVASVGAGPSEGSQFWGVVPVPVGALASGTAYVGDFMTGMAELVRSDVQVYTTDSDITGAGSTAASAFRANILTTLVEARTAPIVHRPEAIAKVAGTVALP